MRRALGGALAVVLLVLTGCSGATTPTSDGVGPSDVDVDTPALVKAKAAAGIATCEKGVATNQLPHLTLACLGGGPSVDLSTLEGPLLINLWYSACGPCRHELPLLQQFSQAHGAQVPVLGIDWVDVYPDAAISLLRRSGVTYPQLADPGGTMLDQPGFLQNQGSPQTFLLRSDGSFQLLKYGDFASLDEMESTVGAALGVTL